MQKMTHWFSACVTHTTPSDQWYNPFNKIAYGRIFVTKNLAQCLPSPRTEVKEIREHHHHFVVKRPKWHPMDQAHNTQNYKFLLQNKSKLNNIYYVTNKGRLNSIWTEIIKSKFKHLTIQTQMPKSKIILVYHKLK